MKILDKLSQIRIEFTSSEVDALKKILSNHSGDYEKFAMELYDLIK
ncbi:hypothetical protein LCGC14_1816140 [marine sediment metagenome]|uniref:Uncharacterized protein n=1 Tax=marine sediment metagenome TaxID=412755 RepID=A0A0F9J060_9ZZZZ